MIRLIRGSGVDGLVGMSKYKTINNLGVFRPLLQIKREELRTRGRKSELVDRILKKKEALA
mgnify:CR=1 FL=1